MELTVAKIDWVTHRIRENGYFAEPVLVEAGYSRKQARAFLRKGEELLQEQAAPDAESYEGACLSLVAGVHAAEARWENYAALCWNRAIEAAAGTGKGAGATAWKERLERRFPDRYKRVPAESRPQAQSIEDAVAEMERERR